MTSEEYYLIIKIWIGLGVVLFPILLIISAPYGRHTRPGWGPVIPNKLGWVLMELTSLVVFITAFFMGTNLANTISYIFVLLWVIHYTNRSLVFPFRTHTGNKKMPLIIAVFAIVFNLINGFMNGYYFGFISGGYDISWLYDFRFIIGGLLFVSGMIINMHSDHILLSLRKSNTNGYSIPQGGLFRYISCPNFFGEIIEWTGFAIMTWSPAALAFLIWTCVNLIPRGIDHHNWYKSKFENYPSWRKAIFPFIL